ncbi:Ribonuclease H-like protein [Gracilaria domingensis]|nr:Ribonuclease H-like protein [Gracilaria domingensis]
MAQCDATLEHTSAYDAINIPEAVDFSASTHLDHLREMFLFYEVDVYEWMLCQTADNCAVNKKVAKLLGIPHVACKSHLLNLEVNHMVNITADLESTLTSVHETMTQCKQRLCNAALLRNIVNLKPIVHNKTRWSGKFYMLERFLRFCDNLIEVSQDERSNLDVNDSVAFRNKVARYVRQLQEIDHTTKYLQVRKLSLANCREALDMLTDDVNGGIESSDSPFFHCSLQDKYIADDAEILADPFFESGVCKIENNRAHQLTEVEVTACNRLLLTSEPVHTSLSQVDGPASYSERLHRRKKQKISDARYRDCSFILGSVAEMERLWSVADNILRNQRMSLTPLLFEAIIFLRVNARLWDVHLVREALHICRGAESS